MFGKARWSVLVAVLGALSFGSAAYAGVPPALDEDASALNVMAQTWPVLQSAAQSYGQLAPYAAATWAGPGPRKQTLYGYWEQCHNTRWDSVTQNLVTGGLNIAGDAEAEAYAIQAVATDYPQQLSEYLVQLVQSGNPQGNALANQIMAQKGPLLSALNSLTTLLNTTGEQLGNAMGPNSTLQPLPISNWQAGIGDAPNLAAVQYIPGPNNGAPIGWASFVPANSIYARLQDICPTGTASLPMIPLKGQVMQAANQAIADEPDLAQMVQPLENGSTWTAPAILYGFSGFAGNQKRQQLVAALASDETGIAGYMAPITQSLLQYNQEVQVIQKEIAAAQGTEG